MKAIKVNNFVATNNDEVQFDLLLNKLPCTIF